jgi:hypothetical protein
VISDAVQWGIQNRSHAHRAQVTGPLDKDRGSDSRQHSTGWYEPGNGFHAHLDLADRAVAADRGSNLLLPPPALAF